MLEKQIEQDLKQALLARDRIKTETLRGIKSALLYYKVEKGKRESGLSRDEEIAVLGKEAKKRQESADLFLQGGNEPKAEDELIEKAIIEKYLPAQLSTEAITQIVEDAIQELGASGTQSMGQVIGLVKAKTAGSADGSVIARLVKERLAR